MRGPNRLGLVAAVAGLLLFVVGVPLVAGAGCHWHEKREGSLVFPDGRVDGDLSHRMSLASGRRLPDAYFDPAQPEYSSWRVVERVPSDQPPGTVLEVSRCRPVQPWRWWPARDFYLTVAR